MSENISLLRIEDGRLCWLRSDVAQPLDLDLAENAEALRAELAQRGHRVVFAAPGAELRLLELPTTREERRHLDAALPFMLEESLAEDVELLHFARQPLDDEQFAVAVVRRSVMDEWQTRLAPWTGVLTWIPEPLLLPWENAQWVLVIEAQRVLLRYGSSRGAALEPQVLEPFLAALLAEDEPGTVIIYGDNEDRDRSLLPDALADRVQWRRGGLGTAMLVLEEAEAGLNLLQGDYAPRLPYERWWREWRSMAALLALALGAHLLAGWLDLRQLESENLALRSEIQQVYREVNPRGAVADPERQLRNQLAALGGGGGGSDFTRLLEALGREMARRDGTSLTSLSYSQRSGEMRISMLAPDFEVVEQVRSALAATGLSAELENSSRSGDRVRARLRVAGEAS